MSPALTRTPAEMLRGLAICLAVAIAGCTGTVDSPREISLPLPTSTAQGGMSPAAQREHQRILASYGGVYVNPRVQSMIEETVARLVAASERPDLTYKVIMLDSPSINAFALPNGHLYVTRGLIALANDRAELASVLAHEMGHVIARHAAIREDQARQAALISHVVADVLSDPQLGALALAKSKLALASFSRAQEFEADGIGVGISARAGFDPFGAARFLTDMQRNAELTRPGAREGVTMVDFLSNHPATPERVRNALANARQFSGPGNGRRDRNDYLAALDGMVFGEDPSEGLVRGRRFLHPKLGFTFVAPPGFSLDNTAQAVLGLKDGGDEAMRLDVVSVPPEQSLAVYLASGWIEGVDPTTVEAFTVNGFPAATAVARGRDWSFRLFAIRFGSDVYRFIFAAKLLTVEADQSFRQSVLSFRRMSLQEAEQITPLRIQVVSVGPHDTVQSLARRMAVPDRKLERFLVLNGLTARDRLKAGDLVKLVVE